MLPATLDAVLVLTSGSHAPIAIEAARAGRHVFVEKPMCFSTAEATEMIEAATSAEVALMVGYPKRYDPAFARFRDEVARLDEPRLLRVTTTESPFQPYVGHYPLTPPGDGRRHGVLAPLREDAHARLGRGDRHRRRVLGDPVPVGAARHPGPRDQHDARASLANPTASTTSTCAPARCDRARELRGAVGGRSTGSTCQA